MRIAASNPVPVKAGSRRLSRVPLKDEKLAARIHKPSGAVSLGLPAPLSFPGREHAMVTADREPISTGKASRVRPSNGLTRHLRGCHVCQDTVEKSATQEIRRATRRCLDDLDDDAKSGQHECGVRGVRHRAAGASGRPAFLRTTAFQPQPMVRASTASQLTEPSFRNSGSE